MRNFISMKYGGKSHLTTVRVTNSIKKPHLTWKQGADIISFMLHPGFANKDVDLTFLVFEIPESTLRTWVGEWIGFVGSALCLQTMCSPTRFSKYLNIQIPPLATMGVREHLPRDFNYDGALKKHVFPATMSVIIGFETAKNSNCIKQGISITKENIQCIFNCAAYLIVKY